jgi:outer membrane lipopolysaccharide assembly protein LptE/RlpB
MIKKNIILLFLIFFLTNCGFTPIYLKNTDLNFSIEQINYTGDRDLNNFLKVNLIKYKNEKNNNKIYIEASSNYKKIILSKDGAGDITSYQLEAEVIFLIMPWNKKIKIKEKKIMDSNNDKFEEARYERSIKQNFASSIANKLSSELITN